MTRRRPSPAQRRSSRRQTRQGGQSQRGEKTCRQSKSRAKNQEPERLVLYWGVFNQSLKRVAKFDFTQEKAARAKAAELSAGGKSPHFAMKVKEPVTAKVE